MEDRMSESAPLMTVQQAIAAVVEGRDLRAGEIAAVFDTIMLGEATPAQIGRLLIGLRMKGVTAEELAGAARAMRGRAVPFRAHDPDRSVDTCGTGGDTRRAILLVQERKATLKGSQLSITISRVDPVIAELYQDS